MSRCNDDSQSTNPKALGYKVGIFDKPERGKAVKQNHSNVFVIFALLTTMALVGGLQAETSDPAVARMQVFESLIGWEPVANFQSVSLRITGPAGMLFETNFERGVSIYFDLAEVPLLDGSYNWELVASPLLSPEIRNWLAYSREFGDEGVITELRRSGHLPDRALIQSGGFTVLDGSLVSPDVPEPGIERSSPGYGFRSPRDLSPMDIIHNDDVIIMGSLNVGFDAIANRGFGFDTVIQSENNLRTLYEDTSNSASSPPQ